MTNYEKYKEIIDLIFQQGGMIALNKDTKEIVSCQKLECDDCLFSRRYNAPYYCNFNRMKWLVAEYTESEVDWSKVPVDTPVLVSNDGKEWSRRHFSRVVNGIPNTWMYGSTSWTAHDNETAYRYIKLGKPYIFEQTYEEAE